MTFQIVQWTDIFTCQIYRDIVIDSFCYCQKHKGLEIYAYVIMLNHIHLLARNEKDDLSRTIRDFKRHISREIQNVVENGNESRKEWLLMILNMRQKGTAGMKRTCLRTSTKENEML